MKEISYKDLKLNPMTMIDETWWLITAGDEQKGYNTMTASWGHLGCVWSLPTAVVYIRPQRFTKQFTDENELFTLSVMGDAKKKELAYLGCHSGRDEDKLAAVGMKPMFIDGTTAIEGAELVLVCRKLYTAPIKEEYFTEPEIVTDHYPERDFHYVYVGEIIKVLVKD